MSLKQKTILIKLKHKMIHYIFDPGKTGLRECSLFRKNRVFMLIEGLQLSLHGSALELLDLLLTLQRAAN